MATVPDLEVDCPQCGVTVRVPVTLSSGVATGGILNVVLNVELAPVTAHAASRARTSLATLNDGAPVDFGAALTALKAGSKVSRAGWNGAGMWLALQIPDEHSKMSRPYIYMSTVDGALVPWVASQSDVLAEDWEIVT